MRGPPTLSFSLLCACAAVFATGCGGGTRQDAGEPEQTYHVRITRATFPRRQNVAGPVRMVITVANASTATIPNIAVTLDSFYYRSSYPELSEAKRPVWVVERGPGTIPKRPVQSEAVAPPGGGQTAYVETWALGSLPSGRSRTFDWLVSPVKPGVHAVDYVVSAGLSGKSKARLPSGAIPHGRFTVLIAPRPPATHVNPNTGKVEAGAFHGEPAEE